MTCGKDPGTWIAKTQRTTCVWRLYPSSMCTCSPRLKRSCSLLKPAAKMPTHHASGACSKRSGLLHAGSNYLPSRGEGAWASGIPTVITIIWHYFFWGSWSRLPWTPLDGTTRHTSVQLLAMAAAAPALGQVGRTQPHLLHRSLPTHTTSRVGSLGKQAETTFHPHQKLPGIQLWRAV